MDLYTYTLCGLIWCAVVLGNASYYKQAVSVKVAVINILLWPLFALVAAGAIILIIWLKIYRSLK